MINIGAEDYNVLKQQYIKKYIRLELLDFQYNIVDELSGNMTKCSINVDSNSDLRRSCDLGFVVTTSTFDIKAGSKLWLDKFVRPYVGYENMRTGEIQWYNQGIYLVNNPQWSYNASTNEISMQALDLMSKLTGLRNGNLEGIPTKIAKDENVREAIISTLALGGFTKYVCEECKTNDGTITPVPYDIEIDVGGTIYDILSQLRDIMPNYQIYFDIDGVFHYEPIPLTKDDPVVIDDDLWPHLLISENINTDFESVKNYVEVYGHTWDVSYYSSSEDTTVDGNTITPKFSDLKELANDTTIGIMLPTAIGKQDILPTGYTQLEYIKTTGTQYIDTGFVADSNTRVVFTYTPDNTKNTMLFGSRTSTTSSDTYYVLHAHNTDALRSSYGSNRLETGVTPTTKTTIDKNKNVTIIGSYTGTSPEATFTCQSTLPLFAGNTGGVVSQFTSLYFYSGKIYDNGTLIRDFVPCKNLDGVIGLYDIVNDEFYQNAGTGDFVAGPDITDVSKIIIDFLDNHDVLDIDDKPVKSLAKDTEWIFQYVSQLDDTIVENGNVAVLDYAQSDGNQYIDTGIVPGDKDFSIVCKIQNSGALSAENWFGTLGYGRPSGTATFCQFGSYRSKWTIHLTSVIVQGGTAMTSNVSNITFAVSGNNATLSGDASLSLTNSNFGSGAYRNQSIVLFAYGMWKMYECQIVVDGETVRNYIPVKLDDGTVCLYDKISKTFFYNAGTGNLTAGNITGYMNIKQFWRFMGHQQAQATSYDNNPSSPFYVGDPIGSSSVGRIRIVLYGGEYDNIYSDDLAKQRADFEIYQRSRLNDSISMETIPIPWMDANIVISHRFGQKQEPSKYIVKSFSVDYATGGTMTINAISWYPYYEESEVV